MLVLIISLQHSSRMDIQKSLVSDQRVCNCYYVWGTNSERSSTCTPTHGVFCGGQSTVQMWVSDQQSTGMSEEQRPCKRQGRVQHLVIDEKWVLQFSNNWLWCWNCMGTPATSKRSRALISNPWLVPLLKSGTESAVQVWVYAVSLGIGGVNTILKSPSCQEWTNTHQKAKFKIQSKKQTPWFQSQSLVI